MWWVIICTVGQLYIDVTQSSPPYLLNNLTCTNVVISFIELMSRASDHRNCNFFTDTGYSYDGIDRNHTYGVTVLQWSSSSQHNAPVMRVCMCASGIVVYARNTFLGLSCHAYQSQIWWMQNGQNHALFQYLYTKLSEYTVDKGWETPTRNDG